MMRMSRADRHRWRNARTLADLGERTAQWLEGRIGSQPGYEPGYGPDEETRDLVPVLARINRAGYVTTASQPGHGPLVEDGVGVWQQRAAVEGWVRHPWAVDDLLERARPADLVVMVRTVYPRRFARVGWDAVEVTLLDDEPVTSFGRQMRAHEVRSHYGECGAEAIREVLDAHLVTLAARRYGPDQTLWRVLDDWAGAAERGTA